MPTPKEEELRRREEMLVEELSILFEQETDEILERIEAGEIQLDDYWPEREGVWSDRLKKAIVGTAVISFFLDMARLFGGGNPPDGYRFEARMAANVYAESYAPNTARDIVGTSRDFVSATVAELLDDQITFDDLRQQLIDSGLSASRARQIAITETTRANYAGEEAERRFLTNEGLAVRAVWYTVRDDNVCPICEPLHGLEETPQGGWDPSGVGPGIVPDAHIGCRCYTVTQVD